MGWLSWIFPSPEDRVAKAKKYLEKGVPFEARLEVLDLDLPAAKDVLVEAENALALANLEQAIACARVDDSVKAREHMELASNFHHGGHEEAFKDTRRQMREIRAQAKATEQAQAQAEAKRLEEINMVGVPLQGPMFDLPPGLSEAERDELEARLALLVEGYPEDLRSDVKALGAPFVQAVLDLENGQPAQAKAALEQLGDDRPLVLWERARASYMQGDLPGTISLLKAFEDLGAHRNMGRQHSAELYAKAKLESGDALGALATVKRARKQDKKVAPVLHAQLLFLNRQLKEADAETTQLVKEYPRTPGFYVLLAQIRVAADQRDAAKRALEASIEVTCCTPGKCGSQEPSLEVNRMLATLYLEDGELERGLELANTARSLIKQPAWEDAYLQALVAKRRELPDASKLTASLRASTPKDGRLQLVDKYL